MEYIRIPAAEGTARLWFEHLYGLDADLIMLGLLKS